MSVIYLEAGVLKENFVVCYFSTWVKVPQCAVFLKYTLPLRQT